MPAFTKVQSFDEAPARKAKKITRNEFIKSLPDATIYIHVCEKCNKEVITQVATADVACLTCKVWMVNKNMRGYDKSDLLKDK
jgi:hypothetical protein